MILVGLVSVRDHASATISWSRAHHDGRSRARARVRNAPEREQKSDPERKGVAIVIDLAKVGGVLKFGPDGPVFVKLG
jgi:hypothetical protein